MPTDFTLKTMNAIHHGLLTISGGRLGWDLGEDACARVDDRRSQERRTADGDAHVALPRGRHVGDRGVAGGDDHHPAWFLNLEANPEVEVSTKGKRKQKMTARVATPDERARMWPEITKKYSNYAGYQKRTTREIPVVLLEPVDS